jgi:hypothetical protein
MVVVRPDGGELKTGRDGLGAWFPTGHGTRRLGIMPSMYVPRPWKIARRFAIPCFTTGALSLPTVFSNGKKPARSGSPTTFTGKMTIWWQSPDFDIWANPAGDQLRTFVIITTEPNPLVSLYHDRISAIIRREQEGRWLEPGPLSGDVVKRCSLLTRWIFWRCSVCPGWSITRPAKEVT